MELHRPTALPSALDGAAQTNRFTFGIDGPAQSNRFTFGTRWAAQTKRLMHGETELVTHSVGGCVSPRKGLDTVAKKNFRPLY